MSEIALAFILVTGAALLVRTFLKLDSVNPGFTTKNVLSASMSISARRFQRTEPITRLVRDGRERLMSVPGVIDAGASSCLPLQGCFGMGFDIPGRPKGNAPFNGAGGLFPFRGAIFLLSTFLCYAVAHSPSRTMALHLG